MATILSPRIKELTMEHSTTDNSGLIDALRKAGAIARDGEEGYRRAAEDIDDWQLRSTLLELARGRGEQADEIERLLQAYGQSLLKGGTAVGALHRTFL